MKIGIVTFHRADNYGAYLQCYGLYWFLSSRGHDVSIIDYRNHVIEDYYRIIPRIRKNVFLWTKNLYENLFVKGIKYNLVKKYKFKNARKRIELTKSYFKEDIIKGDLPKYDCIITGSDQVFNAGFFKKCDEIYYLNFGCGYIKVSYAASIGSLEYIKEYLSEYEKLLSTFDYISLREKEHSQYTESIISRKVETVVDPTLLLNNEEWDEFVNSNNPIGYKKYILLYYVEQNDLLFTIAQYLHNKYQLPIISLNYNKEIKGWTKCFAQCGPEEFVGLIRDATYVVTSSFHATVFSCIYKKDVFIVPHSKTGIRVSDLANIFGIEKRIVNTEEEFYEVVNNQIKYNDVEFHNRLEKSIKFLDNILKRKDVSY